MVNGCQKFHHYIYGKKVVEETDHKPLAIINKKPLRLQEMLLKLIKYDLQLEYIPGKLLYLAHTRSRAHSKKTGVQETEEIEVSVISLIFRGRLLELISVTEDDSYLAELKKVVLEGWPRYKENIIL